MAVDIEIPLEEAIQEDELEKVLADVSDASSESSPASDLNAAVEPVTFDILLHTDEFIAIDKPRGFHVHQPEMQRRRVAREIICLPNLRNQIQTWLYPVHRIDVATEGVLVFALSKASAGNLCRQFQNGTIRKTYFAIVRGWTKDEDTIDIPLELDSTNIPVESVTRYKTHARVELPLPWGKDIKALGTHLSKLGRRRVDFIRCADTSRALRIRSSGIEVMAIPTTMVFFVPNSILLVYG